MNNKPVLHKEARLTISISVLSLALYVGMAFVLHLFIYTLPPMMYVVVVWIFALFYIISKPFVLRIYSKKIICIWVIALSIVAFNYFFVYKNNTTLIDLLVLLSGALIILFPSENSKHYNSALKCITWFSFFFATGSILQFILPPVYRLIIHLFPSGLTSAINVEAISVNAFRGFTTGTGFAASYIIVGIFALIGNRFIRKKGRIDSKISIAYLVFALLLTGKRGIILFSLIAIIYCAISTQRGKKKHKRMMRVFIALSVCVILFLTFEDFLADIPIFREIIYTINGFSSGEDITSGRSKLTVWAFRQFLRHPINGIGWNYFRNTVIGEITLRSKLDVHNVYFQLLCETGVIGFTAFVTLFITGWIIAKKAYCLCISEDSVILKKWRPALYFAFVYETFFILYCLTGNPLYDQIHQIMYVFSWTIVIAFRHVISRKKELLKNHSYFPCAEQRAR